MSGGVLGGIGVSFAHVGACVLSFGQYIRDSLPQMSSPTAKHSQMSRITRGFMVSGRCVWSLGSQNHHTKLKRDR